ncbi:helix-turn-helix domain-containing protein [Rouxiella badensis]|jgi:transcriptional regulator with XRE-family HTH domain|uniref:Protein ninH n=1 Tax=Rouxiella badensis TaxID=1646377 RepID=A0A1X0WAH5_9GAMM|nr:helix-turn-helix domain-containing protein [Rouxiella badensis]MCC3703614.1 phage NinH family protein [Rouxiella badensis]MCC3720581.1 phage NinH family protein [Rouxiella badensis]MCC3730420.1 phage NinH family protein [Rouxiella badensis]MCC3734462.1 phage NinH family protein [Rouxiella badensis]MCC3742744.1 phage NinH family protein [Rouxiella badensis]
MDINVKTIPDLLVSTRGNQAQLARILGVSRLTLKKYVNDRKAEEHAVINGVLMTISQRDKVKKL